MAALLVADCPRCSVKHVTLDVLADNFRFTQHAWQHWFEAYCRCRHCHKGTIFHLSQKSYEHRDHIAKVKVAGINGAANDFFRIEGYVSLKDEGGAEPPEHVPKEIAAIFREGSTAVAVKCWNAAGTMFRLCVDMSTKGLLPQEVAEGGPNTKQRRDLGLRLPWLFENRLLPEGLHELSACIKDDGNDGAHAGTLGEADAHDLMDFATALLERLYTEPKKLEAAKERREKRRTPEK